MKRRAAIIHDTHLLESASHASAAQAPAEAWPRDTGCHGSAYSRSRAESPTTRFRSNSNYYLPITNYLQATLFTAALLSLPTLARAYVPNPSDFATSVVSYTPGDFTPVDFLTGDPFTDPTTALGRPTIDTTADRTALNSPEPVVPVYPAWRSTELVSVGEGGSLTLAFDHPITHDPTHPFGLDFILFGNTFQHQLLSGPSDQGWNNSDPANTHVNGVATSRVGTISVSSDGTTWYTFPTSYFQSGFAPTLGRVYDPTYPDPFLGSWNQWWGQPTDPTVPLNPAYTAATFLGATVKGMTKAYGLSAGGAGFDISTLGLASIQYVRIDNPVGSGGYVSIDALVAVSSNQWGSLTGGSAQTLTNWTAQNAPNGMDQTADFRGAIDADATITLDSPTTLGTINFQSPFGYTLAGPQTLTLQATTGAASINVLLGHHTISAPLQFAGNTTFSVADGAILTVNGSISAAAANLTIQGPGTVEIPTCSLAGLTVSSGTLRLLPGAAPAIFGTLVINPGASVDVTTNSVILTATDASTLGNYLADARLGSSAATSLFGLGVISGSDYLTLHPGAFFAGQTVSSTDILISYTLLGDATLDGRITLADYAQIDAGFLLHGSGWGAGDFNHDGVVDWRDYQLIDAGFLSENGPNAAALIAAHAAEFGAQYLAAFNAPAPEPATLALLLAVSPLLLRRRRSA